MKRTGTARPERAAREAAAALRAFRSAERRSALPFRVLLSGGAALGPFLETLASARGFDWGKSRFYFVSDRTAGPAPLPALARAKRLFFSPAGVPDSSVINFPPLAPRAAARLYSELLHEVSRSGGFGMAVLDAGLRLPPGRPGAVALPGGASVTAGTLSLCREALILTDGGDGQKKKAGSAAGPNSGTPVKQVPPNAKKRLFVL